MPKFTPSDDGKVIDGKTVVFLHTLSYDDCAQKTGAGAGGSGDGDDAEALGAESGGAGSGAGDADGDASAGPAQDLPKLTPAQKDVAAAAQAASLISAAEDAVPFCEECELARRELAAQ